MKIVIVGGGTGGHLYPCLALAETFMKQADTHILFIGTAEGIEARVVPPKGFPFKAIRAKGIVGKSWGQKGIGFIHMFIGLLQSLVHLKRFAPHLVIGIGGYVSGPVLGAACLLGIKRVLLEPNYIPGAMNARLAPFVHLAVTAFEETERMLRARRVACLGVPVRPEIQAVPRNRHTSHKTILVVGGSQGARPINQGIMEALPFLEGTPIQMIHQTGARDFAEVQQAYARSSIRAQVMPFIDAMADMYALSDLVIARAGAGTLSELAAVGLPALLVPFPHALGHQEKNAHAFVASGAAEMILEKEWVAQDGAARARQIQTLVSDDQKLLAMHEAASRLGRPNAAADIVKACFELVS